MSTANKLLFGFGLLLLILVGIGLFVSHRLASVERALATIMAVQEPATATAYEMALNASASSAAVLAHVGTGDPAHRVRFNANLATFGNLLERYDEIARSPASRELGVRIRAAHGGLATLGDSLMGLADQERAAIAAFAKAAEALNTTLVTEARARFDGRGRDGSRKQLEAERLEAALGGVRVGIRLYRESRREELRARLVARAGDFRAALDRLEALRLDDDERALAARLRQDMASLLAGAQTAMTLAVRLESARTRFVREASLLDRLVDDGIHSLARTDLIEAQAMARRAIHVSMIAVLVLLVAGILVGSLTALPVGRSIVRSERALRERMEELALTHARKDEFLGVLGHELRNPLAPLTSSLHVLEARGHEIPEDLRRTHAMMKRQVENMTRLVDDLLDVSRISQGKINLRREPVHLPGLLAQTVEDLRPLAESRDRSLAVSVSAERLWVDADPTRLAQMVSNLVHNAVKFTRPGGRISVEVAREGGEAVVRVADDGLGIPAGMLERVFEPFSQVDPSHRPIHGGLGIGLTLVRRLAELHGGSVEAASPGPDRGSTFTLRLPLAPPPPVPAAAPARESELSARPLAWRPDPGEAPAGARRVLVVDDNRDAAESLADLLRLWGHEVRLAHDGTEAIERAEAWRPELVLLDIGMPGLDGYQVAERLRKEGPDRGGPVLIALTGFGQREDRERALAAGFDHHLTKPVQPATLRRLVSGGPA